MITNEPTTAPSAMPPASHRHHAGRVAVGLSRNANPTSNTPSPAVKPSVVRPEFHSQRAPARHKTCSQPSPTATTTVPHQSRQPSTKECTRHGSDHTSI